MYALGIDIGGSGVKGAIVNVETGELVSERIRYDTPDDSNPQAVAKQVVHIVQDLQWIGPLGCTFPGIIYHGVVKTAANMDKGWVDVDGVQLLERATGCPVRLLNDGDAAGIAEMQFGAGRQAKGVTIMLTFGTGIGSAIFVDDKLLPNTEFGHLPVRGKPAEHRAAGRIKKEDNLSWAQWADRVNEYLGLMEFFFSPDLFIIGGGVSRKQDKFLHLLRTRARIVPAQLLNDAGIIGAAFNCKDIAVAYDAASAKPTYPDSASRVQPATSQEPSSEATADDKETSAQKTNGASHPAEVEAALNGKTKRKTRAAKQPAIPDGSETPVEAELDEE